jgi:Acetyltransferase (GNAT) domain
LRRPTAAVGAAFLAQVKLSRSPTTWVAAYQALQLPLALNPIARRYRVVANARDFDVLCIGREERFRPWLARLLGGRAQLRETRIAWRPFAPGQPWPTNIALVLVELHPWLVGRYRAAGWLVCPGFVGWRAEVSELPPARQNSGLRSDVQLVKRNGYVLRDAGRSARLWRQFRSEMIVPYAAARFESDARISPSSMLRRLRKRGRLLILMREGRSVAGVVVVPSENTLWVAVLGVSNGDLRLLKEGCLAAIYLLTLEWARQAGIPQIDFGGAPGFQRDGLTRYKRKWGLSPVREPLAPLVAAHFDQTDPVLRSLAEREPFFIDGERGLEVYPAGNVGAHRA